MALAEVLFNGGLTAYLAGAAAGLVFIRRPGAARLLVFGMALLGALLETVASAAALTQGATVSWNLPCGVTLFSWTVRLDPLSAFFSLALGVVAAAVSIYSWGYLRNGEARRGVGLLGFFYNVLLLSLALVFTASNAFFFLLAWEVMALSAYCLVSFEHEKKETRKAGTLFLIMSHAGTGLLLMGFLVLATSSGSLDFSEFHLLISKLAPQLQAVVFVLFFLGFGVKAGIIPIHVWLPAAHPVAPSNISALMSGIVIKAGIYGMARVFFDFLDVPPLWVGILVLMAGVISGLLGVLYALMEHDLKRLLAYHSIENIGIILIGFGGALMFRSLGHANLAAIALIAGLYHTLNHAIFKCLLFLGAGSVLHSTHTRNMEKMGGLIRRMPVTALFFLIGAIAISGLPPLNGFVSEWLTYQALLAGFGTTQSLTRLMFPVAGALLALTAALAAACFVKAFGITFLALPRSEEAAQAREVEASMLVGMAVLAMACVALGLGAAWFLPVFDPITQRAMGVGMSSALIAAKGMAISAGSARSGTVSTPGMAAMLVLLSAVPALLWAIWGRRARRRTGPTWDCGLPGLTADNEYTATAFSKPLRMIFSTLYRPRREIQAEFEVSPYYPTAIHFESEIEPSFEKRLYDPIKDRVMAVAGRMRAVQAGSIHAYLAYIFVALILLLLFGARG
ncbi:MAG: hydrogenase 4 subunit B [Acidobacteria bacterium]|nr:hydrogenase 4 subunit B [Acidobacteriota bacterium]